MQDCARGMYTDAERMDRCESCAAGRYAVSRTSCTDVPSGQINAASSSSSSSSGGLQACSRGHACPGMDGGMRACPPGKYSNRTGASECLQCIPGTFADINGSLACASCPAGFAASASAAASCTACAAGRFAPAAASSCLECPSRSSSLSGACSKEECFCDVGFWRPAEGPSATVWAVPSTLLSQELQQPHHRSRVLARPLAR